LLFATERLCLSRHDGFEGQNVSTHRASASSNAILCVLRDETPDMRGALAPALDLASYLNGIRPDEISVAVGLLLIGQLA